PQRLDAGRRARDRAVVVRRRAARRRWGGDRRRRGAVRAGRRGPGRHRADPGHGAVRRRCRVNTNAYTFLPWLRTGISTQVTTPPQAGVRATVKVQLLVSGDPITGHETLTQPVNRDVQLYGPG